MSSSFNTLDVFSVFMFFSLVLFLCSSVFLSVFFFCRFLIAPLPSFSLTIITSVFCPWVFLSFSSFTLLCSLVICYLFLFLSPYGFLSLFLSLSLLYILYIFSCLMSCKIVCSKGKGPPINCVLFLLCSL